MPIDDGGVQEIASRARGTPRVANRLLKRVRDYAQVRGAGVIDAAIARQALGMLEVDDLGLDSSDRRVLHDHHRQVRRRARGPGDLSAALNEDADTIMDVYEPYLIQLGFLERTPRGRVATRRAYEHLGLPYVDRSGLNGNDRAADRLRSSDERPACSTPWAASCRPAPKRAPSDSWRRAKPSCSRASR